MASKKKKKNVEKFGSEGEDLAGMEFIQATNKEDFKKLRDMFKKKSESREGSLYDRVLQDPER